MAKKLENTKLAANVKDYKFLVNSIGGLLEDARKTILVTVNAVLVKTNWEIGRRIVEFEQGGKGKAKYGSGLIDRLSKDLTSHYGKGFSAYSVRKMRQFYLSFPIWATVSPKLSWSHFG